MMIKNTAHETLTTQTAARRFLLEIVVVVVAMLLPRLIRVPPPVVAGLDAWSGGSKQTFQVAPHRALFGAFGRWSLPAGQGDVQRG